MKRSMTLAAVVLVLAAVLTFRQSANAADVEATTRPTSEWAQFKGRTVRVQLVGHPMGFSGIVGEPMVIDRQVFLVLEETGRVRHLVSVKDIATVTVYPERP